MTLYDISMKMLIANFRKYKLYFLCNVFSIALFFSFAAIFTNKVFMDGRIVNSMISSNVYTPSVLTGIFLVLFVPYSNYVFLRSRKYEYGVLMTLGMSEKEVLINMFLENCIISGLSLFSGLILGTLISFGFYFIVQNIIGISALHWGFNADSYKFTAILYSITMVITLVSGILGLIKRRINDLIKDRFMAENKRKSRFVIFIAGVIFVIISVLIMLAEYGCNNDNLFLISLAMMFVGIFMIITQVYSAEWLFVRILPNYTKQHLLEISFVKQHHKSRSKINIISAWMIGFSIFFAGFCMVMFPYGLHQAITYSPYDMVYSRIFGMNKVQGNEIEKTLNQAGVSIKNVKNVEYLRSNAFNLLSMSEVNKKLNCNYHISKGKFLEVFQYDMNDSFGLGMTSPKRITFNCGDSKIELKLAGSDTKILFNRNATFADFTLILSDSDYNKIASKSHEFWSGVMKLYTFNNWKASEKGVAEVQQYLLDKNKVEKLEQNYYKASSKIETYTIAKQSAGFILFMMSFIVVLFYGANIVMIHFKIISESEEEHRIFTSLYRLGVSAEEMLKIIQHKNMYYFLPQAVIGLFIGVFYISPNKFPGYGWKAAGYSLLSGIVLLVFQLAVIARYSRRELLSFDFMS